MIEIWRDQVQVQRFQVLAEPEPRQQAGEQRISRWQVVFQVFDMGLVERDAQRIFPGQLFLGRFHSGISLGSSP